MGAFHESLSGDDGTPPDTAVTRAPPKRMAGQKPQNRRERIHSCGCRLREPRPTGMHPWTREARSIRVCRRGPCSQSVARCVYGGRYTAAGRRSQAGLPNKAHAHWPVRAPLARGGQAAAQQEKQAQRRLPVHVRARRHRRCTDDHRRLPWMANSHCEARCQREGGRRLVAGSPRPVLFEKRGLKRAAVGASGAWKWVFRGSVGVGCFEKGGGGGGG